jgi:hypothetical protein
MAIVRNVNDKGMVRTHVHWTRSVPPLCVTHLTFFFLPFCLYIFLSLFISLILVIHYLYLHFLFLFLFLTLSICAGRSLLRGGWHYNLGGHY